MKLSLIQLLVALLNTFVLVTCWPDFFFFPHNSNPNYTAKSKTLLEGEPFDKQLPTVFIVHGFNDWSTYEIWVYLRIQLNRYQNVNVIMVDWKEGAKKNLPLDLKAYTKSQHNARLVARAMTLYIKRNKIEPNTVTCIGHSLGAHTCGFVGKNFGGKLARIVGIDPAGPSFRGTKPLERIDASDAVSVECIHTSALVGIIDPICKINFYPNNMVEQPMCFFLDASCGHAAGVIYFAESVKPNNKCKFYASKCDPTKYTFNQCDKCFNTTKCIQMGFYADRYPNASGSYFLRTKRKAPYCVT